MSEVLIVGGGIAGLLESIRLSEQSKSVTLLEARDQLGGNISSAELAGVSVDTGAESFSTIESSMLELIGELGLGASLAYPPEQSAKISSDEASYEIPVGFFGVPADLENSELAGIVSASAIEQAKTKDQSPFGDYETVEDLILSRLGPEFLEKLVEPVVSGVHGESVTTLSANKVFGRVIKEAKATQSLTTAVRSLRPATSRPGSAVASLQGGMNGVVAALAEKAESSGVEIKTGVSVTQITKRDSWQVETNSGNFEASKLVMANGHVFENSDFVAAPRNSTSILSVAVKAPELNDFPIGPGSIISRSDLTCKATTHLNAKWSWLNEQLDDSVHVVRFSFRGDVSSITDAELALAFQKVYGVESFQVVDSRWDHWSSPASGFQMPVKAKDLDYVGSLVSGNGLSAIVRDHYERSKH